MRFVYWLVLGLIFTSFIAGFMVGNGSMKNISGFSVTGKVVAENDENYSRTRAICNENNQCIDVLIKCENGKVLDIIPVSPTRYYPADWKDPRNNNQTSYC